MVYIELFLSHSTCFLPSSFSFVFRSVYPFSQRAQSETPERFYEAITTLSDNNSMDRESTTNPTSKSARGLQEENFPDLPCLQIWVSAILNSSDSNGISDVEPLIELWNNPRCHDAKMWMMQNSLYDPFIDILRAGQAHSLLSKLRENCEELSENHESHAPNNADLLTEVLSMLLES